MSSGRNIKWKGARHRWLRVIVPGALVLCSPLRGQTAFEWLSDAVHPRSLALANSTVAAQPQMDGMGLNPAGLIPADDDSGPARRVTFGLRLYPAGISQRVSQLVLPAGRQVLALDVRSMSYGDFEGFDSDGNPTGDYTAGDLLVRTGFARRLGRIITIGATVGGVISRLDEAEASALLWSLGLQLAVPRYGLCLGVVAQNQGWILNQYVSDELNEELPAALLVGLSKSLAHLPLTLFVTAGQREAVQGNVWRLGGEFALPLNIKLRFGLDDSKSEYSRGSTYSDLTSGFSFGLGSATDWGRNGGRLKIDGALKLQGPLGATSALALALEF